MQFFKNYNLFSNIRFHHHWVVGKDKTKHFQILVFLPLIVESFCEKCLRERSILCTSFLSWCILGASKGTVSSSHHCLSEAQSLATVPVWKNKVCSDTEYLEEIFWHAASWCLNYTISINSLLLKCQLLVIVSTFYLVLGPGAGTPFGGHTEDSFCW